MDVVQKIRADADMYKFAIELKSLLEEHEAVIYERAGIIYAASRNYEEEQCRWVKELGTSVNSDTIKL